MIPIHDEEPNLNLLYERLTATLSPLSNSYELVLVDDGSQDQSADLIYRLSQKDARVKLLKLSRNYGQQVAIRAGLDYVNGNTVIIMDADLQDPPEFIPRLLAKLEQGYDIAVASRGPSKDKTWAYRVASRAARRIIAGSCLVQLPTQAGVFRAMNRATVEALQQCREKFCSLNSLTGWIGFSVAQVPLERSSRYKGSTSYKLSDCIDFTLSALLGFALTPWRYIAGAGGVLCAAGIIILLVHLYQWVVTAALQTNSALMVGVVFFLGGIQLLVMGLLGESIARTHIETAARPLYVVRESVGLGKRSGVCGNVTSNTDQPGVAGR